MKAAKSTCGSSKGSDCSGADGIKKPHNRNYAVNKQAANKYIFNQPLCVLYHYNTEMSIK